MVKILLLKDTCNLKKGDIVDVNYDSGRFYQIGNGIDSFSIHKDNAEVVEDIKKECITCSYFSGLRCERDSKNDCDYFDKWKPIEVVEDVEKSCFTCKYDRYNTPNDMYCDKYAGLCDKYSKWQPIEVVAGVGQDAPTVTNEQGGKQSATMYAFDCLDAKAMFAMCKVLKEGRDKYGSDENWRKIPVNEHINHALIHFFAYMAGDKQDEHLSHALCRAMFALAVADNE